MAQGVKPTHRSKVEGRRSKWNTDLPSTFHLPPSTTESGSLLVVTLWLIVVLAMAVVALASYLSTETRLMRYHLAQAQAKAWAKAGVYLAMQRLAQDAKQTDEAYDWLGDDWAVFPQQGPESDPTVWIVPLSVKEQGALLLSGSVAIHMTDEERKLDLNTAGENPLARLLADPEAAKAIVDYRDPDDEGVDDTVQPPYVPKNGPITTIEELWDIPRVSAQADVTEAIAQHGSVWTQGLLNINTVEPAVFTALAPDEPAVVERLVSSRPGLDGQFGTDDDCKATRIETAATELASCAYLEEASLVTLLTKAKFAVRSSIFRILAFGETQHPLVRYQVEAIVTRKPSSKGSFIEVGGERFQILAWKEG